MSEKEDRYIPTSQQKLITENEKLVTALKAYQELNDIKFDNFPFHVLFEEPQESSLISIPLIINILFFLVIIVILFLRK